MDVLIDGYFNVNLDPDGATQNGKNAFPKILMIARMNLNISSQWSRLITSNSNYFLTILIMDVNKKKSAWKQEQML